MSTYYGGTISGTWRAVLFAEPNLSYSATQSRVSVQIGCNAVKKHEHSSGYDTYTVSATNQTTVSGKWGQGTETLSAGENWLIPFNGSPSLLAFTKVYTFARKASAYTVTISFSLKHSGKYAKWEGTSTAKATFTIPALPKYTITYNGNGSGVTGVPSSQTKTHNTALTLSSAVPKRTDYTFKNWKATDGTYYSKGASYTKNASTTLTAQWSYSPLPTIGSNKITIGAYKSGGNAINRFSTLTCTVTNAKANSGNISTIKVTIGSQTSSKTINASTYSGTLPAITPNTAGTFTPVVTITNSFGSQSYSLPKVTVVNPTWTKEITLSVNAKPPVIGSNGKPQITLAQAKNYTKTNQQGTDVWDTITITNATVVNATSWKFTHTFSEDYVKIADRSSADAEVSVRVVSYTHYDRTQKPYRKAFYSTTRNCNFSNGIYNTMFVSGVDSEIYPEFNSRVWWCAINDPLYFPDLNYIEVGSNDNAVKGLAKVGDYLGAIKQSKTTDTAIYLIYPTSFDDETTYAVKQGVQGVGALGKYTFNILGDETLFLSPYGVMAITPTGDDEHKVQNRSFFVDGRLLKENNLADAYSFVYDGMYWLSVIEEDATCYVLDGNQRNSWGNDKTVLVYECYLLDNVPARCFAKINDDLVFSTGDEVCRFKKDADPDPYLDGFDFHIGETTDYIVADMTNYTSVVITQEEFEEDKTHYYTYDAENVEYVQCTEESEYDAGETYYINDPEAKFDADPTLYYLLDEESGDYVQCAEGESYDPAKQYYIAEFYYASVPVKAEWSTVFDDDNALHYYKTMQKKGNLVSILPRENELPYKEIDIDEDTFNENKTLYFTYEDDKYVRCTAESVYDPDTQYFVENRSSTKVFVKKDDKDLVEIERSFGLSSDIPSEMYLRKKFKKYKRLQFVIRNEEAEPFGVDEIVKNYIVGNYAKK